MSCRHTQLMLSVGVIAPGRSYLSAQTEDDMSQPIDWKVAAKFAKLNYLIASDLANGQDAPRWYAGDFFGDKFAAGQPKASKGNAAP